MEKYVKIAFERFLYVYEGDKDQGFNEAQIPL